MSFLITSHGRTATKWLAWVMNHSLIWTVNHEPLKHPFENPYYGEVNSVLKYRVIDIPIKLGIINRNLKQVFTSFCNRRKDESGMLFKLSELKVENHLFYKHRRKAVIIDYKRMTTELSYLQQILDEFKIVDVTPKQDWFNQKINVNPNVKYKTFEDLPEKLKNEFNKHKWLRLTPTL
jgi:hypothetical protein